MTPGPGVVVRQAEWARVGFGGAFTAETAVPQ